MKTKVRVSVATLAQIRNDEIKCFCNRMHQHRYSAVKKHESANVGVNLNIHSSCYFRTGGAKFRECEICGGCDKDQQTKKLCGDSEHGESPPYLCTNCWMDHCWKNWQKQCNCDQCIQELRNKKSSLEEQVESMNQMLEDMNGELEWYKRKYGSREQWAQGKSWHGSKSWNSWLGDDVKWEQGQSSHRSWRGDDSQGSWQHGRSWS